MTRRLQGPDISEEQGPVGDMPPGNEGWLQEAAVGYFESVRAAWKRELPTGHEPVTKVDGEDTRVGDIRLRIGQKATEYSVRIAHEAGDHQKEIITTLTVAGLLLVTKGIHSRRKDD